MANRKGVFIGAYVPNELKESLRRRAAAEHRTLSQEITRILVEAVHGKGLPAGSVDRRDNTTVPRRRSTDPLQGDVPKIFRTSRRRKKTNRNLKRLSRNRTAFFCC
jgi:plasmid stability protein